MRVREELLKEEIRSYLPTDPDVEYDEPTVEDPSKSPSKS